MEELRAAAERGASIRFILPDPDNDAIMQNLAHRFAMERADLVRLIRESTETVRRLSAGKNVEVWYLPDTPVFSFYIFDRTAILALYSHRHDKSPVPAVTVEEPGTLYEFLRQETAAMMSSKSSGHRVV